MGICPGLFPKQQDNKKRRKPETKKYRDTNLTDMIREAVTRRKPVSHIN